MKACTTRRQLSSLFFFCFFLFCFLGKKAKMKLLNSIIPKKSDEKRDKTTKSGTERGGKSGKIKMFMTFPIKIARSLLRGLGYAI